MGDICRNCRFSRMDWCCHPDRSSLIQDFGKNISGSLIHCSGFDQWENVTEVKESAAGVKHDQEKPRLDLVEPQPLLDMAQVLTFGAKKYSDGNWKNVPDAKKRYYAAAMRHMLAWWQGEQMDPESGVSHLAHAACCIHFLQWFDAKVKL